MQLRLSIHPLLLLLMLAMMPDSSRAEPSGERPGEDTRAIESFTISPNPATAGSRLTLQVRFDITTSGANRLCLYYPAAMGPLTGFANQIVSGLQDSYTHTAGAGPGSAAGSCPLRAGFYAHQWETPNVSLLAVGGDILQMTADLGEDISGLFTLSFLQTTGDGGILNAFLIVEPAPALPAILVSPENLQFGGQPVNSASPPQPLSLENSGNAELEITSISDSSPDFVLIDSDCGSLPIRLAPGAACTLNYAFTPTHPGPAATIITIESNAPGSPHSAGLQGNGIPDLLFSDRFEPADSPGPGNNINNNP